MPAIYFRKSIAHHLLFRFAVYLFFNRLYVYSIPAASKRINIFKKLSLTDVKLAQACLVVNLSG